MKKKIMKKLAEIVSIETKKPQKLTKKEGARLLKDLRSARKCREIYKLKIK